MRELIFIHIPKTGGISIQKAIPVTSFQHHYPQEVQRRLGLERWNAGFKFAVVRHPATRFMSAYYYLKQQNPTMHCWAADEHERHVISGYHDFEDFCLHVDEGILNNLHFVPQVAWLQMPLDKIYTQEHLDTEFAMDHGVVLPRLNASNHRSWNEEYTTDMMARIKDLYKCDFALGYGGA